MDPERLKRLRRLREKINQSVRNTTVVVPAAPELLPKKVVISNPPPTSAPQSTISPKYDHFELYLHMRTFILAVSRRDVRNVFERWHEKTTKKILRRPVSPPKPAEPVVLVPPVKSADHSQPPTVPLRTSVPKPAPTHAIPTYIFKRKDGNARKVDQEMLSAAYHRFTPTPDESNELSQTEPVPNPLSSSPIPPELPKPLSPPRHPTPPSQISPKTVTVIEKLEIEKDFVIGDQVTVTIESPRSPTRTQRSPATPRRSPNSPNSGEPVLSSAIRELRDITVDDPFELNHRSDRKVEVSLGKAKSPPERFVTPMAPRGPLVSSADVTLDVDEPEIVEDTAVARRQAVVSPARTAESYDEYDEPIDQYFLQEARSPSRSRREISSNVDEQLEASKLLLAQIDRMLPKDQLNPRDDDEEEDAELDSGTYNQLMDLSLSDESDD
jgi:hypothetical protein